MPASALADPARLLFVVLPVLLLGALAWGVFVARRREGRSVAASLRVAVVHAAAGAAWMALTWAVAASGILREWDRTPPPFAFLVLGVFTVAFALAFGPTGRGLARQVPLWILIGVQGFRFPLELAMHEMYERGIMPEQMSYSGLNFDIVSGISALVVAAALALGRGGRRLAAAWNILGLVLLANIVIVAIASTPRFAFFGPERLNEWVMDPPYVWLPAVMVTAALAGHLIIFRALTMMTGETATSRYPDSSARGVRG